MRMDIFVYRVVPPPLFGKYVDGYKVLNPSIDVFTLFSVVDS